MAHSTVIEGALIAHHTYSYDFDDRSTGKRVAGDVNWLHVVTAFDAEPERVKVKNPALFAKLVANGPGSEVRLECEILAKPTAGGRATTELVAVQALPVESRKAS